MKLLVLALLTGCAHEATWSVVRGPSGAPAALVQCRGDVAGCYAAASRACAGGPYGILDSSSQQRLLNFGAGPVMVTDYSVLVECHAR